VRGGDQAGQCRDGPRERFVFGRRAGGLGVRRISVGSALSRAALGAFVRAAREIRAHGTIAFAEEAIPYAEVNDLMVGHARMQ